MSDFPSDIPEQYKGMMSMLMERIISDSKKLVPLIEELGGDNLVFGPENLEIVITLKNHE